MVEIINGRKVELYNSIEDMPILRFQKYNKFIIVDSLVGSDLSDVASALSKAISFIDIEKLDEAKLQLQNIISCISLISQEMSPKYLAFAALVKSIDGLPNYDLSDAGLTNVLLKLNEKPKLKGLQNLTHKVVTSLLDKIKKKSILS